MAKGHNHKPRSQNFTIMGFINATVDSPLPVFHTLTLVLCTNWWDVNASLFPWLHAHKYRFF